MPAPDFALRALARSPFVARLPRLALAVLCAAGAATLPERAAAAESIADKANARALATEGIDLYNQGKYREALDRLQRAQALFDAPIHLLYIARAQALLGKLVEASETYRRLIRVELSAETPAAVREAVEAADAELDGVAARVAALRIEVIPEGEPGLILEIDGEVVSAAVVGIERPLNPGRHRVEAAVPDGRRAETSIELGEGARAAVRLELGPAPVVTAGPSVPRSLVEREPEPHAGWFVGGGLGLWLPLGRLAAEPDVPIGDYVKPGAGLELRGGYRFGRYFGAQLFVDGALFTATNPETADFGPLASSGQPGDEARVESSASAQSIGVSLLGGSALGKLGGFGEVGIAWQRLSLERSVSLPESSSCGGSVSQSLVLGGPALRVGGGATIPVAPALELVPFAHATIGRYGRAAASSSCDGLPGPAGLGDDVPAGRRATHATIVAGLGGHFVFGRR